jgi:hypothetical protein
MLSDSRFVTQHFDSSSIKKNTALEDRKLPSGKLVTAAVQDIGQRSPEAPCF